MSAFLDFFLNLDTHLNTAIQLYGVWVYLLLFVIIFCETGLVVTPLLPGDSLLFAVGTFAALGSLNLPLAIAICGTAAIIGDTVNYWIGFVVGPRVFTKTDARFFKKRYLEETHRFYQKHGGKTIIIARFLPIIRTFAPFVAGIGKMQYGRFFLYNIVGALVWVGLFTIGGFYFGTLPFVRENFTLVILAIIAISFVPVIIKRLSSS